MKNAPYIPIVLVEGVSQPKPKDTWNVDDIKKVLYDKKSKNIIASYLGLDEFFRVYNCQTTKKIWETLKITSEGMEALSLKNMLRL